MHRLCELANSALHIFEEKKWIEKYNNSRTHQLQNQIYQNKKGMKCDYKEFQTVWLQKEISYQNRLRFAIVVDVARVCGMFRARRVDH